MSTRLTAVVVLACLLVPGTASASDHHQTSSPASPGPWTTAEPAAQPDADEEANVKASMAELPLCFEQNLGQSDPQVAFLAHASLAGRFAVGEGGRVEVRLGAYDATRPLVIDPVLSYSTYLGGSGDDEAYGIAVDSSHAAYVTGYTQSADFPTASAFDPTFNGGGFLAADAFVAKLS